MAWSSFAIKDFVTQAAKLVRSAVITVGSDTVHLPAHVLVDSDGNERSVLKVKPGSAAVTAIVQVQTNATGTNYSAFESASCSSLTICNGARDAVPIEVRLAAATTRTIQIPVNGVMTFVGLSNANEVEVRRADTSNTQIYIKALAN